MFLRRLYEGLVFMKIFKPYIVVRVDGGICSQMHQYLLGFLFKKKGFTVKYDLTWFDDYGMDLINKDVRNFDLIKAFPRLSFERVNPYILKFYRHFYNYEGHYPFCRDLNWVDFTPPKLLSGYYADPDSLYSNLYQEVFNIDISVLDNINYSVYQEIDCASSAAIHVRGGDLASGIVTAYGIPVSLDYFKRSVDYLKKGRKVRYFYLFTDDKKYLEGQIIPFLDLQNNEYKIIPNGADKGYVDLILMSKFEYLITSKGTLGKYAVLLNLKKRKTVIVCSDDTQTYMLDNNGLIEKISI